MDTSELIYAGLEAIQKRGKAQVGEKTMVDIWSAFLKDLQTDSASKENLEKLMMNTSMLSKDLGTVLVGEDAVMAGLVNEVGGIDKAYQKLRGLMNK